MITRVSESYSVAICRFVMSHPLVASAVIGATSIEQLKQQIAAAHQGSLPPDILEEIDLVHGQYPNPTP